jgi:hypothetical protein
MKTTDLAEIGVALACVGVLGFAIQRGSTCMVAAVEDSIKRRRISKFLPIFEASLWVSGATLLAHQLGLMNTTPIQHPVTLLTFLGGGLLGIGSLINRACAMGTLARLGSGDWAFALTPLGYFLGCLSGGPFLSPSRADPAMSLVTSVAPLLLVPFIAFVAWRGLDMARVLLAPKPDRAVWPPHRAAMLIGLSTVLLMISIGNWSYTEVLASIAKGMKPDLVLSLFLFATLLCGALIGGFSAGKWGNIAPTPAALARCLVGGVVMGWGSLMIPGGNDALVLLGLPLLLPYAVVALLGMTLAIAAGFMIEVAARTSPVET